MILTSIFMFIFLKLWEAGRHGGNQLARQMQLGGTRQFLAAFGINQQQRIVVLAKRRRTDVTDQQRHAFFQAFGLGVGE